MNWEGKREGFFEREKKRGKNWKKEEISPKKSFKQKILYLLKLRVRSCKALNPCKPLTKFTIPLSVIKSALSIKGQSHIQINFYSVKARESCRKEVHPFIPFFKWFNPISVRSWQLKKITKKFIETLLKKAVKLNREILQRT